MFIKECFDMDFLNIHEILDIIDKQFGYDFEGKDKDDHLISRKTWNKYVSEFFEEKTDGYMSSYEDKIKGGNRYAKYREDFVKKVIDFRKDQLIKQYNSNRKTTVDHKAIKVFETIASTLGVDVDEEVYKKKIPITQYKKQKEERYRKVTEEEIENKKEELLQIVISQLIDMEKINHDIAHYIVTGSLEYGLADPLEMNEDIDGSPLGYRIDAKNYLKESVKSELIK